MPAPTAALEPAAVDQTKEYRTYAIFVMLDNGFQVPPGLQRLTRNVQRVSGNSGLERRLHELVSGVLGLDRTFLATIVSDEEPDLDSIDGVDMVLNVTSYRCSRLGRAA